MHRELEWESFEIPEHIKYIVQHAFLGCKIKEIIIPNTVEYISGNGTFAYSEIEHVEFPAGVKTDKYFSAFTECVNLKAVDIPKGVITVGGFEGSGVVSVDLPDTVQTIEQEAFKDCANLTEIKLPKSVITIKYAAFMNCTSLRKLGLPKGIRVISLALAEGSAIEELIIPDTVVNYLEHWSLSSMPKLKKIKFSNSVDTVPEISYCPLLELVIFPDGIQEAEHFIMVDDYFEQIVTVQVPKDKLDFLKQQMPFCNVIAK